MKFTSDWHIHSRNSCDEAALTVSELIADAAAAGIEDFGLTDHIHTPYNLPDLIRSRQEFDSCHPSPRFHFGVEASCVSQWEIDEIARTSPQAPVYGLRSGGPANSPLAIGLTAEDVARLGIEYVVGGTHWPMYVPWEREAVIRDFHRQNMFLATHPLITIVAHPWWWHNHWKDENGRYTAEPWLDDFGVIPQAMHDEFSAAVRQGGKVVEINISAMILNRAYPERFIREYIDYLVRLKEAGVKLSLGSDCHYPRYAKMDFAAAEEMLAPVGLKDQDLWRLPARI